MRRSLTILTATAVFTITAILPPHVFAQSSARESSKSPSADPSVWHFGVSGDSRNCGDVVMPAIAGGVWKKEARFYWLLGDFRAIYDFDQDMQHEPEHIAKPMTVSGYLQAAWPDFIQNQLQPFGTMPVFLGIGNHDTIPPMTREAWLLQFADWLDTPALRRQRLSDDRNSHRLTTYYHWVEGNVDFITLDNATEDQFDAAQMTWFEKVLAADRSIPQIQTIVVGMHEALPDSISAGHSMNQSIVGTESGRRAYADLLKMQNENHKHVYVIASHSHYFMDGIFNTEYWRTHGGLLPGWIVGTAGAVRYGLPANAGDAHAAETNVYGFLLGTVKPSGEIHFEFQRLGESDVPEPVTQRFTPEFVHWCFAKNSQALEEKK